MSRLLSVVPECVAIVGMIALIWWGCWATLRSERQTSLERAARDAGNLAQMFEESTRRIIASGDQALLSLRAAYLRDGPQFDIAAWSRDLWTADWFAAQLAVVDADGVSHHSTISDRPTDVSDREHFLAQRDAHDDRLFISRPLIGRLSKQLTVNMSRRIVRPDGSFGGIAVLSLDCDELSGFYQSLARQHGSVTVVGLDGIVRARGPLADGVIGARLGDVGLPPTILAGSQGVLRAAGMTIGYRRLAHYPLVVAVEFDDLDTLAHYWAMRSDLCAQGLFATLVILGAGALWVRQRQRSIRDQDKLTATLDTMNEGLVMLGGRGGVELANRRALALLGLPETLLPALQGPEGARRDQAEVRLLTALDAQCAAWRLHRPNPSNPQRVVECSSSPAPDGGAIHVLTDVTTRHLATERIRHLAMHDALTGLGNGTLIAETLDELLAGGSSPRFVVMALRLGRFKRIGDMLGQELSEPLLLAVVARLSALIQPPDMLFRRDSDDLAVLSRRSQTPDQAMALAHRLQAAFAEPFLARGQEFRLTVAIGFAQHPEHAVTRAELVRYAELACADAASREAKPILSFIPSMIEKVQSRVLLEEEVGSAIHSDQLYLEYQPQFRATSLDVIGFEALVRWQHPRRGPIGPAVFIAIAEETGLVIELGRRILRDACVAAVRWPEHVQLAVNLSPVQFRDPTLIATISAELARSGLAPWRLELEVTEGVLIDDERQALDTLYALKRLGVRLALDDFGTGYSSLSYLRKFPFERIKLDRSFVQAQETDIRSRQILQCILDLSAKLGLDVIAEGVETRAQLTLLRQQGCQEVQGFLVGRPMSAEQTYRLVSFPAEWTRQETSPALSGVLSGRQTADTLPESTLMPSCPSVVEPVRAVRGAPSTQPAEAVRAATVG